MDDGAYSNTWQKRAYSCDELDTAPYTDDEDEVNQTAVRSRTFVNHHDIRPSRDETLTDLPESSQLQPPDPSCHADDESIYDLYSGPDSLPDPPREAPTDLIPEWKREAKTMETRYSFLDVLLSVCEADRRENIEKGLTDTAQYLENDPLVLSYLDFDNEDRDESRPDPEVGVESTIENETEPRSEQDVDMDIDMKDSDEVEQDPVCDEEPEKADRIAAQLSQSDPMKPLRCSEIEPNSWNSVPETRPPANSGEREAEPTKTMIPSESRILYPIMGASQRFELASLAAASLGPVRNPCDFEIFRHPANTAEKPNPGLIAAAYVEDLCGKRTDRRRQRQRRD
ncbi:MAG: hypothetical protein Q9160_006555 [Pyrenula sp. 1 TL-2023]